MVELKTRAEIDAMRAAGQVVARALAAVRQEAAVGVSLLELDRIAHAVLDDAGASSPFLGYRPRFADTAFPAVICASVNDALTRFTHPERLDGDNRYKCSRYDFFVASKSPTPVGRGRFG